MESLNAQRERNDMSTKYYLSPEGMVRRRVGFRVDFWCVFFWQASAFSWFDLVIMWPFMWVEGWKKISETEAIKCCGAVYPYKTDFIKAFEKEMI